MKKYKCHKEVHAEPMTPLEYVTKTGNQMPEHVALEEEGYHVVYSKGTPDEYHSWSPKKALDDGYTLVEENPPEIEEL
jgi:hypothetical protein